MKQIASISSEEEWLKILGKGMVTLPKDWRDELGLESGKVIKAKKVGSKVILEAPEKPAPYRLYSDEEIEEFLKEDQLPPELAKKLDKKIK